MTIHKHFVILSAKSLTALDNYTRRLITYANLQPFAERMNKRN